MQRYVVGFIFNLEDSRVLLMEKNKPEWQKGYYNGIGGKIEEISNKQQKLVSPIKDYESPQVAMSRECEEECGLQILPVRWTEYCVMLSQPDWAVHCLYTLLPNEEYIKYQQRESERIFDCLLSAITPTNKYLLGNISWLIGLALDYRQNKPFRKVIEVPYIPNELSLPLIIE